MSRGRGRRVRWAGRKGGGQAAEWLPGPCCLSCASLHPRLGAAPALRVEDHLLVLNTIFTHGLGMHQGPAVRQQGFQRGSISRSTTSKRKLDNAAQLRA